MNMAKVAIGILITIIVVALVIFATGDYMGVSGPSEEPENPEGETVSARQVMPPEIYLNSPAGSELIKSGSTKVMTGNISLTFKFTEPVNIEKPGGFSVDTEDMETINRIGIGYAGVDRTVVWMNIPPSDIEAETLNIRVNRDIFFEEGARLREPVELYINRYEPNVAEMKRVSEDGSLSDPEYWTTEGTKVFNLSFKRPVNIPSVERTILGNMTLETEHALPEISFDWENDSSVEITLKDLSKGVYEINLSGAEDIIGLKMQGEFGIGNSWRFDAGERQSIKSVDLESEFMGQNVQILEGEAFDETRYLSGRVEDGLLMLHRYGDPNAYTEYLSFEKVIYWEETGETVETEQNGNLKSRFEKLVPKGWRFRGIRLSPGGETAAAFMTQNEIGKTAASLMLIDMESGTMLSLYEMPFHIYAAGDGTVPMDLHFDWVSDKVIFSEGYSEMGNVSDIYGINTETGMAVALVKKAREPRFIESINMLSAIKLEKTGQGTFAKDGEEEKQIDWHGDAQIILLGIYGNQMKTYDPIEGYTKTECPGGGMVYDAPSSMIWSWENKLVYPQKVDNNNVLVIQDLGTGEEKKLEMEENFTFLGIKDGKAYLLDAAN